MIILIRYHTVTVPIPLSCQENQLTKNKIKFSNFKTGLCIQYSFITESIKVKKRLLNVDFKYLLFFRSRIYNIIRWNFPELQILK